MNTYLVATLTRYVLVDAENESKRPAKLSITHNF